MIVKAADLVVPLSLAETVTVLEDVTVMVVIVNVTLFAPAGTVTLAGSDAAALLSDSVTTVPLAGAAPFSVTVPVEGVPPLTEFGLAETERRAGRLTVNVAFRVVPFSAAEIVTDVEAATGIVVTVNVAVVDPAPTVTLAGTVAAALLLDNVTAAPPVGAAPLNVTVPVEVVPPVTLAGFKLTVDTFTANGGFTVNVAPCVTLYVPEIVTGVEELTELVVTVNVAVVDPAPTVTLAGTVAAALLLDSVTAAPPVGAAPLNVTVPVEELPPTTVAGLTETDTRLSGAVSVTVALAFCVASAALVAVTVTLCCVVMLLGAVYNPVWSSVPTCGLIVQFTAVFPVPVTVAWNFCVCPAPKLAVVGLICTPTPVFATIWIASILGRSTDPVRNWIAMLPLLALVVNVLSSAMFPPPACAKISKFVSTVVPLIDTPNTRCPAAVNHSSANFKVTA